MPSPSRAPKVSSKVGKMPKVGREHGPGYGKKAPVPKVNPKTQWPKK